MNVTLPTMRPFIIQRERHMTTIHNPAFRAWARRELKFAPSPTGAANPARGAAGAGRAVAPAALAGAGGLDWVPVGDFSFYDQVLDMSFTLGHLPERVQGFHGDALDNYFAWRAGAAPRPRLARVAAAQWPRAR